VNVVLIGLPVRILSPIAAVPALASGVLQGGKNLAAFRHSFQEAAYAPFRSWYPEAPVSAERPSYLHDNRTRWPERTDHRRGARHRPRPGPS
jgi:hypothetical protein